MNEQSEETATQQNTQSVKNHEQVQRIDERQLSRLVAARLDLPISQRLLDQNFKLSVIKRCWEDQIRIKSKDRDNRIIDSRLNNYLLIFLFQTTISSATVIYLLHVSFFKSKSSILMVIETNL